MVTVPAVVAAPTVNEAAVPVKFVPAPLNVLPVMVPVAEIKPAVVIFPPATFPEALTLVGLKVAAVSVPETEMLFPTILPEADIPVVPSKLNGIL